MVGAAIPDRNRVVLVLPVDTITALTGLPWTWGSPIALIFTLLVTSHHRKPLFTLFCVGIASHVVIDYIR